MEVLWQTPYVNAFKVFSNNSDDDVMERVGDVIDTTVCNFPLLHSLSLSSFYLLL